MDTLLPVETGILLKESVPLRVETRQEDQTMDVRTQQCVLAVVDSRMLAVDVPRVLVIDRARMLHNPIPLTLPTRARAL